MHFTLPLTTIILGFGSAAAQGSPSPDVVLIYPASSIQANQPFNLGYSATIVDARQTVTFSLTAPNGTNPTGSDEPDTSDGCNGTSSPLNFVTMSLSDLGSYTAHWNFTNLPCKVSGPGSSTSYVYNRTFTVTNPVGGAPGANTSEAIMLPQQSTTGTSTSTSTSSTVTPQQSTGASKSSANRPRLAWWPLTMVLIVGAISV